MQDDAPLGRLEDLPAEYVQALRDKNLVPLWPSLRGVLPPQVPTRQTQPIHWAYADIKPLLLQAGELTPIEKAERRVLVLANPGHTLEKMQASSAIYLGMCPMSRGDLILTPTGLWHEHGHDGDTPVVWLDVLDLPLVYYMEASYHLNGARQTVQPGRGDRSYQRAGLVPSPVFGRSGKRYPMLRYPWVDTRAALQALAGDQPGLDAVQLTYVNPETGEDAENILGFYALMLRPGQTLRFPARSPACVFHLIEGSVDIAIEAATPRAFTLAEADTCCAPGYTGVTLRNRSADQPAFVFLADEAPLHRKLGVHEVRA